MLESDIRVAGNPGTTPFELCFRSGVKCVSLNSNIILRPWRNLRVPLSSGIRHKSIRKIEVFSASTSAVIRHILSCHTVNSCSYLSIRDSRYIG